MHRILLVLFLSLTINFSFAQHSGKIELINADVSEFAQALVRVAPDQCLWASDWPHPQIPVPMPNDGDLMDQLADWIPVEHLRNQVLVENPTRLYGF